MSVICVMFPVDFKKCSVTLMDLRVNGLKEFFTIINRMVQWRFVSGHSLETFHSLGH